MAPKARSDDDDDELESPSSLWASAVSRTPRRNPTRSRLADQVETPTRPLRPSRRTSPRFVHSNTLQTTPPSARATPARSRTSERGPQVDSKLSDSAERRRQLADELFPPSPPPVSSPSVSNAIGAPVSEAESESETDWVADSEVEREDEERRAVRDDCANALQSPTSSSRGVTSTVSAAVTATRLLDMTSLPPDAAGLEDPLSVAQRYDHGVLVSDSRTDDREKPSPAPADSSSLAHRLERLQLSDPTPKKRPVKLPRARPAAGSPAKSPTTSPRETAAAAGGSSAGDAYLHTSLALGSKSKLRVELDLTGDSSEEDGAQRKDSYADTSDEELPLPTHRRRALAPAALPAPARRTAPRLPLPPAPRTPASKSGKPDHGLDAASSAEKRLTPTDRATLPLALIRDLDRAVFRKRWNGLRIVSDSVGDGLPEGIEVVWNARLRSTAGRASWKTSKKTTTVDGVSNTTTMHHAMVELSTKVTDTAAKLRHTLAHELCHLATWAIDGEMKPPHGAAFKLWAKRVMLVRPDIEVTTTHSYEIEYKYRWKCVSAVCGKIFGRHSASIDPATHGCPCGARIVPIDKDGLPKPGYSIVTATGMIVATPKSERKKSKWVEFLQSESPVVRKQNPTLSQPEIFKVVAERWKFAKEKAAAGAEGAAAGGDIGGLAVALDALQI